jgi:hypothetical protein
MTYINKLRIVALVYGKTLLPEICTKPCSECSFTLWNLSSSPNESNSHSLLYRFVCSWIEPTRDTQCASSGTGKWKLTKHGTNRWIKKYISIQIYSDTQVLSGNKLVEQCYCNVQTVRLSTKENVSPKVIQIICHKGWAMFNIFGVIFSLHLIYDVWH